MATSTVLCRLSSRLRPVALKINKPSLPKSSPLPQTRPSAARISRSSRLPVELSCLESMMPLHSAIASARLRSSLSIETKCWGLVPQGISMPL
ncbi:protein NUCLEAR FUSION DEFECTIVE 6, mitochondrial [Diospyros lotus]|uniref:protein NUCLEAR FUSION DEFECTIVE 6, mitochondrial n=1 Tax=Diospyros lotus TaxID=55363 RepID=UPI00224D315A|nr:protein NUCLEAR FUSION DEFECTIVE 6, mitochondrial [Diospyros lotus]